MTQNGIFCTGTRSDGEIKFFRIRDGLLSCNKMELESIDIPEVAYKYLDKVYCSKNNLKILDLSKSQIKVLTCSSSDLTSLSLPNSLEELTCWNNRLKVLNIPPSMKSYCSRVCCDRDCI